jgi:hypothetical protein
LELTRQQSERVGARHVHWCQLKRSYQVRSLVQGSDHT